MHFDLQEEDDGPPVRRISELDGETFFTPRTALPKRKQALLLIEGARDDIKQHNVRASIDPGNEAAATHTNSTLLTALHRSSLLMIPTESSITSTGYGEMHISSREFYS